MEPIEFARFRLVQGLPFAASEALVDGVGVGSSRVLAAAVRRSVVRSYETIAAEAGFVQECVDLLALVALAPLLRGGAREDAFVVVLGDRAVSLAYLRGGGLVAYRNRLRDPGAEEFARLRDEIARTVLLGAGSVSLEPQVHALGQDADAFVAALRSFGVTAVSGWGDSSEPAASAWLARALA
jgi:hypothetical protein